MLKLTMTLAICALMAGCGGMPIGGQATVPHRTLLQTATADDPPTVKALDNNFLQTLSQNNQAEIQMAQLALRTSPNNTVRSLAMGLINDHSMPITAIQAMANINSMSLDNTLAAEATSTMTSLQSKTGLEFDRAFVRAMMDSLQRDIELARPQATQGTDLHIRGLAIQLLPVLESHLLQCAQVMGSLSRYY